MYIVNHTISINILGVIYICCTHKVSDIIHSCLSISLYKFRIHSSIGIRYHRLTFCIKYTLNIFYMILCMIYISFNIININSCNSISVSTIKRSNYSTCIRTVCIHNTKICTNSVIHFIKTLESFFHSKVFKSSYTAS